VAWRGLPAEGRVTMPWKNGGGVTREIAAWPPSASLDAFDWRISMANVDVEGPFSRFENVDRVLTVVKGSLALQFGDGASVVLTEMSDPLAFAGEAPCLGAPSDGGVIDLNVMVRRGRATVRVRRCFEPQPLRCDGGVLLLLALDSGVLNGAPIAPYDAMLAAIGDVATVTGPWPRLIAVELVLSPR